VGVGQKLGFGIACFRGSCSIPTEGERKGQIWVLPQGRQCGWPSHSRHPERLETDRMELLCSDLAREKAIPPEIRGNQNPKLGAWEAPCLGLQEAVQTESTVTCCLICSEFGVYAH
jgi:hypothetical protein